ncbi:MAG: hypothetical protein M1484_01285 [Patescibacteria group bacterium]|nr:hypothetical protein [Patescibacteria group bacterium]MCL5431714.1 hypothetical protein [Patescibacteria group bacterium]
MNELSSDLAHSSGVKSKLEKPRAEIRRWLGLEEISNSWAETLEQTLGISFGERKPRVVIYNQRQMGLRHLVLFINNLKEGHVNFRNFQEDDVTKEESFYDDRTDTVIPFFVVVYTWGCKWTAACNLARRYACVGE